MSDRRLELWEMRNGEKIRIEDMKTSHIVNSIALIERSNSWRVEYLSVLKKELEARENAVKPTDIITVRRYTEGLCECGCFVTQRQKTCLRCKKRLDWSDIV